MSREPFADQTPADKPARLPHLADAFEAAEREQSALTLLFGNGLSQRAKLPFGAQSINERARRRSLGPRARTLLHAIPDLMPEDALRYIRGYPLADISGRAETSEYRLLRQAYVRAVVNVHPSHPSRETSAAASRIGRFFQSFHAVFTTNYDLLTHWTIGDRPLRRHFTDRFAGYAVDPLDAEQVRLYNRRHGEGRIPVLYLHGALHLLRDDNVTTQLSHYPPEPSLRDQIERRLVNGFEPGIVLEGSARRKVRTIQANAYLSDVSREFAAISGVLATYGWGFNLQDQHLVDAILRNQSLSSVWISLYGDPDSDENRAMRARIAHRKSSAAEHGRVPETVFYSADSAPF